MIRKIKWVVLLLAVVYLVIFITANNQTVVVNYFWGKPLFGFAHPTNEEMQIAKREGKPIPAPSEPRQVQLMLIILASFLAGVLSTWTLVTIDRLKFKSKVKKEKKELTKENQKLTEEMKTKEQEMAKKLEEAKSSNTQNQTP
jgi:uncharacterized integral membrane protein